MCWGVELIFFLSENPLPIVAMACFSLVKLCDLLSHCELEEACLDREVCRDDYCDISKYLSEWKLLAPKLGLTDAEVEAILEENQKEEAKRVAFLKKWKQKFVWKATYRVPIEALLGMQRAEDATGVCQLLKGIVYS